MPKIPEKPAAPATPATNPRKAKAAAPKTPKPLPMPAASTTVVHPEVVVELRDAANPITVEMAKHLLGWVEEEPQTDSSPGTKFGDAYLLTDEAGHKVRCLNNTRNRPFEEGWSKKLAQDILNRHWMFNGEAIIIGKSGQVLSGQHRLIALVLAYQKWASDEQKYHWQEKWETEPVMHSVLVYGVDESSATTRTLDNVKPRSFADVLFTESGFFGKAKPNDRKVLARMVDYAIKLLWHRTGEKADAYSPQRTHSEGLEYLERHKKILPAVNHIFEENQEQAIAKYISPGTAAGAMYLMAACNTDGDVYRNADTRSERKIDLGTYEKAEEFWMLLGNGGPEFKALRSALRPVTETGEAIVMGQEEKLAVLAKAWKAYLATGKVRPSDCELDKAKNSDDELVVVDELARDFGGIDLGDPKAHSEEAEAADEPSAEEQEAVKAEAERIKADKIAAHNEKVKNGKHKAEGEVKKPVPTDPKKVARGPSRKEVEAQQTEKARKADEELAAAASAS